MANNDYLEHINLDGVEYDIKDNISGYITGITGTDVTEALGDISANNVFAGPTSGNADEASFRQLVADDIPSIPVSKISDFPSTMPPSSHTHGNITNSGDITTTATIATGDRLVINDESASKVTNSSITFGTSTTTFLANNGTWLTPANTDTKVAQNPINDANEYPILIKHSANEKKETDEVNFVESKKEDGVTINPSTSVITAAQLTIRGSVSNDSDAATKAYADGKQTKITASGILKGNGNGTVTAAVVGTDYQEPLPSQTGNSGKFLTTNGSALSWGTADSLPDQTGNNGKYLTTNGTTASWGTVDALPAQSGNSGKYLTTNGTTASWGTINALPSQSGNSGKFLTTNGTTASWANVDALPESSIDTPQYLRYDGPNVNDSAYWDELPIYEQINYTQTLLFEANNLYMTDPGIWSDSNYDGQGVNEFANYIIQSGITTESDFPQIGFSIQSTTNLEAEIAGSLICSQANVSTIYGLDYEEYSISCVYETPSGSGWKLEVSFSIEYTYNSLDNIYDGYISSITLTSLGADSTFDPANIILQALLPDITIHKLDGKFLNENAAPLNTYMKKDVDYVTAGKQYGTTLGTKATAEGEYNTASGNRSHAEGYYSSASGAASHAENYHTTASGSYTHAEGYYTTASGNYSHAEGYYTTAQRKSQHVFGEYNILDTAGSTTTRGTYVEIVGNGSSTSNRNNARTLDWSGNETLAGKLTLGADPTANMEAATKQYVDNKVSTLVVPTIKTIENPQISAVNGVFTWTISASSAGGNTNSNILITIYELSTGAVVYPNVVVNQSTGNVTITINGTGTLAAETYKAVIMA